MIHGPLREKGIVYQDDTEQTPISEIINGLYLVLEDLTNLPQTKSQDKDYSSEFWEINLQLVKYLLDSKQNQDPQLIVHNKEKILELAPLSAEITKFISPKHASKINQLRYMQFLASEELASKNLISTQQQIEILEGIIQPTPIYVSKKVDENYLRCLRACTKLYIKNKDISVNKPLTYAREYLQTYSGFNQTDHGEEQELSEITQKKLNAWHLCINILEYTAAKNCLSEPNIDQEIVNFVPKLIATAKKLTNTSKRIISNTDILDANTLVGISYFNLKDYVNSAKFLEEFIQADQEFPLNLEQNTILHIQLLYACCLKNIGREVEASSILQQIFFSAKVNEEQVDNVALFIKFKTAIELTHLASDIPSLRINAASQLQKFFDSVNPDHGFFSELELSNLELFELNLAQYALAKLNSIPSKAVNLLHKLESQYNNSSSLDKMQLLGLCQKWSNILSSTRTFGHSVMLADLADRLAQLLKEMTIDTQTKAKEISPYQALGSKTNSTPGFLPLSDIKHSATGAGMKRNLDSSTATQQPVNNSKDEMDKEKRDAMSKTTVTKSNLNQLYYR